MEATFNVKGDSLEIRYRLRNALDRPIYLFNKLWAYSAKGDLIVDPHPLYASMVADDRLLRLGKVVHPLPKLMHVEQAMIPMVQEVAAGATAEERIALPLPIREHNPYYPSHKKSRYRVLRTEHAEFCLSWLARDDETTVHASPINHGLTLRHPRLYQELKRVSSDRLPIEVEVKVRGDRFERF